MTIPQVSIWCDGSVYPSNPGYGGWGAVTHINSDKDKIVIAQGGRLKYWSSNNQSETIAVLKALEALPVPYNIVLFSDSTYTEKGVMGILKGIPLKSNTGLWHHLGEAISFHKTVKFIRIKGHSGNMHHNMADKIAYWGARYGYEVYERFSVACGDRLGGYVKVY